MLSVSKAPVFLRGRLSMFKIVVTEDVRNELVFHDLLHQQPYQLRARNTALFCRLLEILHLHFDNDTLDCHYASPMCFVPLLG